MFQNKTRNYLTKSECIPYIDSSYTVILMTQIEVPQSQKLRTASNKKKRGTTFLTQTTKKT